MMEPTHYPQLVDGFAFSGLFGLRPNNGLSWYWSCLANMEDLRLAADSYRPRSWIVPKQFLDNANPNQANILPGKTVFYEFQVKEGSWLWGMQFSVHNDVLQTIDQTNFSVVVRQGSDLAFMDRPELASGIFIASAADAFNTLKPPVNPLPYPRLIIPPCQIHVEVSNNADPANPDENAVPVQLLLLFAEPK